ncbi:MAG: hypothetical protein ACOWWO_16660 [Peptococcaceae bacterium]
MGVVTTCLVTIILESLEVLGIVVPVDVELLVEAPLPVVDGEVLIDLEPILGIDLTIAVPCPSVDFEVAVDLGPLVVANLVVTTTEAV